MIPKDADHVFEGLFCDVYKYPQIAPDGVTKLTYESVLRRPTIHVIAIKGDKIILSHERQAQLGTFYNFFGGLMEKGEKPLESAKRELLEESGMVSDHWEHLKTFKTGPFVQWEAHYFIARDCKTVSSQNLDPGEDVEIVEFSFEELVEIVTGDNFRSGNFSLYMFQLQKKALLDEFGSLLLGTSD